MSTSLKNLGRTVILISVFLAALTAAPFNIPAQDRQGTIKTVTGHVTDENGEAAPGIAVMVKGTTTGTMTDENGNFRLSVKFVQGGQTPVLVFSCIGKITKEIRCTREHFEVEMEDELAALVGAIINTGYQRIDRRMSTSSVASISGEDVLQANATTLDNMLQGKIPGLSVMGSSSTPGAATKVRIRGTSTISGNREPLWVVDGVILDDPVSVSTEMLNNLDNVNLIGNAISGLNPMDIEKIDVLKDASATAIYGVRAANGVIVVTTKRGKMGAPRVNYSGTVTVTERPSYNKLNLMDSRERIDVSKEIAAKGLVYSFEPAAVGYEGLLYDLYDRKISYDQFLSGVQELGKRQGDRPGAVQHYGQGTGHSGIKAYRDGTAAWQYHQQGLPAFKHFPIQLRIQHFQGHTGIQRGRKLLVLQCRTRVQRTAPYVQHTQRDRQFREDSEEQLAVFQRQP